MATSLTKIRPAVTMRPTAMSADVTVLPAAPAKRSWLPWGLAGSAVISAAGYTSFLLASQAFLDSILLWPIAAVTFLMTAGGLAAFLGIGAHYVAEPARPASPPVPAPDNRFAGNRAPIARVLPANDAARLVAPLASEIARTMAPADARLRGWNALNRVVDGVPVVTFRWNLGARTEYPAGFRAVAVPLTVPADGVRSTPILVVPGETDDRRLLDFPDVREALAPLAGSWVAIHGHQIVLHVQELGSGTMPTQPRIAAAIAIARAVDAASEAFFWQRPQR